MTIDGVLTTVGRAAAGTHVTFELLWLTPWLTVCPDLLHVAHTLADGLPQSLYWLPLFCRG